MNRRQLGLSIGLVGAALLALVRSADAALIGNGDPVGGAYTIANISAGLKIDFTAHTPDTKANSNTIGRLTVEMSHSSLVWLGFDLNETDEPVADSPTASGGFRVLVDVIDINGMTVDWVDYHIRAVELGASPEPGTSSHKAVAHFHDSASGSDLTLSSAPLVLQGVSDNVVQLDFGLGAPVVPTDDFGAADILLHERDFAGYQRMFRVETIPSVVPEPTTFMLAAFGILALIACAWRPRFAAA